MGTIPVGRLEWIRSGLQSVMLGAARWILFVVGLVLTGQLAHEKDSLAITTTAFGVVAVLATLTLSLARSLDASGHFTKQHRPLLMFAAERFFIGSVILLTASMVKYGMDVCQLFAGTGTWISVFVPPISRVLVPFLFAMAWMLTYQGWRFVLAVLERRARIYQFNASWTLKEALDDSPPIPNEEARPFPRVPQTRVSSDGFLLYWPDPMPSASSMAPPPPPSEAAPDAGGASPPPAPLVPRCPSPRS